MERAIAYSRAHRDQALADLQALLRQPSVAAQDLGMDACADLVASMLEAVGARVERVPLEGGYPVIYGEIDAGAPRTLLFYNHYDVQPPEPLEEWAVDPFAATVRDGRLIARGVADNKGNLMTRIKAVEAWLRGEGRLPVNVKFVIEGEEEIGSVHLHQFMERYADRLAADGVVWESGGKDARGRPVISAGCKGILYVELVARAANQDLHSSLAAIVPNPAWRLVQALATLKDVPSDRVLIEGFYDDVRGPTPAERALLERFPLEEDEMLAGWGLESFIGGLRGVDLQEKLLYAPTCTICGIVAGYTGPGTKTVLPREARVKLDFRLVPDQRADDILAKLRAHLDRHGLGDLEILVLGPEDPAQTDPDHPLVGVIRDTAREVYGVEPVVRPRTAGTGPMFLFHRIGLTATVDGVGIGHHGSLVHAPNENVFVEDYYRGIEHVIRILDRFAAAPGR
ncbi:MAG TPA: M20/M25/M40 family metallo-hydrolase [Thermaerobacter sp.]